MNRCLRICSSILLFLSLAAVARPSRAQAPNKPITEHGLEQSLRVGALKDTELINQIRKRGVDFFLSSDTGHLLTGAGASPAVLEAVRANYRGQDSQIVTDPLAPPSRPAEPAPNPIPSHAALPQTPGVYLQRGGTWVALQQESAEYVPAGVVKAFGKASGGLLKLKGDVNAEIAGSHSNLSVKSPGVFLIRMPAGLSAADYLLIHTHAAHDNREFKISAEALRSKDAIQYRMLDLSGSNLQIEVSQGAGDYAFVDANSEPSRADASHKTFLATFQITP